MSDYVNSPTVADLKAVGDAVLDVEVAVRQLPADLSVPRRERIATAVLAGLVTVRPNDILMVRQALAFADELIERLDAK
jgi:hypothetical protein